MAISNTTQALAAKFRRASAGWIFLGVLFLASLVLFLLLLRSRSQIEALSSQDSGGKPERFIPPAAGTWRFIVSGDSRNCGDVVVPTIAADSSAQYQPSFYWHLGDLRAIYKVDEDMAAAAMANGQYLGCENYLKQAWPDFIHHQIGPFGSTPFYLGIGNHEVIPPKNNPPGQFAAAFKDWLLAPAIKAQRLKDKDCDNPPAGSTKTSQQTATPECLVLPRNYYHWIQGGVDFIYLDNTSNVFGADQITWLKKTLASSRKNDDVRSIVVGMHEALPGSLSADHAMCDTNHAPGKALPNDPYPYKQSCDDGQVVYNELVDFQNAGPKKNVYVLASHSHFYMQGIFNIRPEAERLQGWIVGTAGAVRYPLPKTPTKPDDVRTNVYGYLLGTVDQNGKIEFKFQEVKVADVPSRVSQEFTPRLVNWCFAHNSEDIDPNAPETTTRCPSPPPPQSAKPTPGK